ncbi:hypothetical protein BT96DRAFT_974196 [Gymnopus androsaceus JB14]|uniref:Uncharacterized protein n=1 Tax=Gymnopus androsaceus JB14 TaxID=1447944 RepID=A0A6A4HVS8_9AGAR|nr:hypothetical protein BT96DRAFT_974196 [Gymnopus androsaceus JB14]
MKEKCSCMVLIAQSFPDLSLMWLISQPFQSHRGLDRKPARVLSHPSKAWPPDHDSKDSEGGALDKTELLVQPIFTALATRGAERCKVFINNDSRKDRDFGTPTTPKAAKGKKVDGKKGNKGIKNGPAEPETKVEEAVEDVGKVLEESRLLHSHDHAQQVSFLGQATVLVTVKSQQRYWFGSYTIESHSLH